MNVLQTQYKPPPASVSIPSRPSLHRQLPPTIPSRHSPLPTWSNQEYPEPDFSTNNLPPTMSDRPRLKDFLAAMKPDTWGSTTGRPSKRSSVKREENMYIPPPVSNINDNNQFYANTAPPNGSLYSSVPSIAGPALTSISNFSPRHYQVQSSLPNEQPKYNQSHLNDPNATLLAQNLGGQSQMMYNSHNTQPFTQHQQYPTPQSTYQPNLSAQQAFHQPPSAPQPSPTPQLRYQSSPTSQPVYQPPPPQQQQQMYQPPPPQQQQQTYQPPPAQQQQMYQPPTSQQQQVYQPPPPQHQVYQPPPPQHQAYQPPPTQQQVYQPPQPQQPMYQPTQHPSYQHPAYQVSSIQQPAHPSFAQQPPISQQMNHHQITQSAQGNPSQQPPNQPSTYQNPTDPNRSTQQSIPPAKFDPYRPQPVGAYDIPKPQNPPNVSTSQPPPTTIPARVNPHDVYRPGGLLTTNQSPMPSVPANNNNNYNPNQFVQYAPSPPPPPQQQQAPPPPPPPAPLVPTSTPTSIPVNVVSTQSSTSTIVDDLLSLALEQQIDSSIINTEPNSPEPQSPIPLDEESQPKSNGKPIACIQPLPTMIEEKPSVQPIITPVASLSPSQDPYDDKEKLDQLVSDVQRFEKHVSTMTKKILNGTVPLEVEWKVRLSSKRIRKKKILS